MPRKPRKAKPKSKPFTKTTLRSGTQCRIEYRVTECRPNDWLMFIVVQKGVRVWDTPYIVKASVDLDSLDAYANFAAALMDAVREARKLDKRTGTKVSSK